jgi:nitrogenase molybdenum-iron protein beta chain
MLDLTPKEHVERTALRINSCKTCQPVGALFCALGVHNCMPYSHGSQGCVAYHRTFLTRHFKEPAMASTSSFTEGACVFGGGSNLKQGTKNVFDIYDPDIIAVHTTCLSETIGDDLNSFIIDLDVPDGKIVVHANTPSYVGSHINGYFNMMCGFIKYLSKNTGVKNGKTAIFPGWSNPGDLRELKRLLELMDIPYTMFPDQSGVMDAPMTDHYKFYPKGGTTIPEIVALGDCQSVIGLGELTVTEPCEQLKNRCKVEYDVLPYPIGIENTDKFIMALSKINGGIIPYAIEEERGQLIDLMLDAHIWFSGKTCAIFGDPDYVLGLTSLVLEMGMIPKYVLTGTPGSAFIHKTQALFEQYSVVEQCLAKESGDLFELHQWIKESPVDLLIGSSYGKQITRAEDIPFVRSGFPVLDRYGHPLVPITCYKGAIRLVEQIANALMDRIDRDVADEDFDVIM